MCCLVARTAPWGINTRPANTNADQPNEEEYEYDFEDEEKEE